MHSRTSSKCLLYFVITDAPPRLCSLNRDRGQMKNQGTSVLNVTVFVMVDRRQEGGVLARPADGVTF